MSGCDHQTKEQSLVSHPEKFRVLFSQCYENAQNQLPLSDNCQFILNLGNKQIQLLDKLRDAPKMFGKEVLSLQIQQAKLKEQIAKNSKKPKQVKLLKDKLAKTTRQLNIMLAILGTYETP